MVIIAQDVIYFSCFKSLIIILLNLYYFAKTIYRYSVSKKICMFGVKVMSSAITLLAQIRTFAKCPPDKQNLKIKNLKKLVVDLILLIT